MTIEAYVEFTDDNNDKIHIRVDSTSKANMLAIKLRNMGFYDAEWESVGSFVGSVGDDEYECNHPRGHDICGAYGRRDIAFPDDCPLRKVKE